MEAEANPDVTSPSREGGEKPRQLARPFVTSPILLLEQMTSRQPMSCM